MGLYNDNDRLINETFFEKMASNDPMQTKQAADQVQDYTRFKMREDGFLRRILPPIPVQNDQLNRLPNTEKPSITIDKESDSPAAMTIGFNTMPNNLYIRGNRYVVAFDRIVTPKFTVDTDMLRTYTMDIRQILSDNSIKDMLAEEDGKMIRAVNLSCVGPDVVVPTSGVVQHEVIRGGISREAWSDSLKVMPNTPSSLEVSVCLLNNLTVKDLWKWGHDEMGGSISQDILKDGWSLHRLFNQDLLVTIKKGLVPTNRVYHFADPKFLGKFLTLEDTTMYIRREAFMLEFYSYETVGGAIANTSGVAIIDYRG